MAALLQPSAEGKMQSTAMVRVERDGELALVIAHNPPVNTITAEVRAGLRAALVEMRAMPGVAARRAALRGEHVLFGRRHR